MIEYLLTDLLKSCSALDMLWRYALASTLFLWFPTSEIVLNNFFVGFFLLTGINYSSSSYSIAFRVFLNFFVDNTLLFSTEFIFLFFYNSELYPFKISVCTHLLSVVSLLLLEFVLLNVFWALKWVFRFWSTFFK